MGVEDREVGTRDIVLRKRGAINRNVNQVLDKVPIRHRPFNRLSCALLFPDHRHWWYRGMLMEFDVNGNPTVPDREVNEIEAGSSVYHVALNHKGQPPQMI